MCDEYVFNKNNITKGITWRIPYVAQPGWEKLRSTKAAKEKSSDVTLQILGTS